MQSVTKLELTFGKDNAPTYLGGVKPKKYFTWLVNTTKAAPVVNPLTRGRDR